ncbi:MAG: transposase [Armatimonadetes bacterium]|nr:transposase [Armatimonadota bacterium]
MPVVRSSGKAEILRSQTPCSLPSNQSEQRRPPEHKPARSFLANQFRLILHAAAFVLMQALSKLLAWTEMASAQCSTIRVKLLNVGVQVRETTRRMRIWLLLPRSYPYKRWWEVLLNQLVAAQ